ncbi:MAG TPA: hypothetical protein VEB68_14315 [Croceibacterium sp.]|nr:hypothetical protein [Croceibacterium sp.]
MTDFDKMAEQAKAASDARISEAAEGRQKAADEKARRLAALEDELEENVIPTLEEAAAAFARQGIPVTIHRNWRPHQADQPTVTFVCDGPRLRTAHGTHSSPRGAQINIHHEAGKMAVKLERPRSDGIRGFGGKLPDALRAALEYALISYIERRDQLGGVH